MNKAHLTPVTPSIVNRTVTPQRRPNADLRTREHLTEGRGAAPYGRPFVFTSERGTPFATAGFARMVELAGAEARLGFKTHPHMLRHACRYTLANKGHDTRALQAYLGHRNIQHTVRYTELSPTRFKDFWRT
jgi:site-specific recombinase XerD